MDKTEFIRIRKFIVKLGKMLHKYGTPAFRLEAHLQEVAEYLGVNASFIATPTALTFVIWSDKHEDEYNHAARVQPGELDLGSLSRTDELVNKLLADELTLYEADAVLDEIDAMPNPYGKVVTGGAFFVSTGAFAMLMGASWNDVLWSALIGLVVYFWVLWAAQSKRVTHMLEPAVATVAGLLACAISSYVDPSTNIRLVVLSSIIVFIPGLALALGLAELSARHLVSGTARVMDAIMLLFKLYFGAFLGIALGFAMFGQSEFVPYEPLPKWMAWYAILMLCSALVVIFRLRLKHAPWALLSGFIAYGATFYSSAYLEQGLGTFVGAFAVGVYSNLFTRIMNAPATIVVMQGLIVLVPGSKTYIGLNSFVSGQDFVHAEHIGQETFLIFMSLVAGLIFANVAMPTKKAL
ncbi:threonine/serine exporter family protein [Aliiglaciecola sp. CAU 1673]|uniref:threonine/serine ThrE exporter family protein n=1 Tax=Aliiglaciecola sp. CAU 1673 TaxID=3032595 RepID=UPI0023DA2EDC|nr:threonine/serine exporter family protein [Aliiglaciecola sp. CAU 1673]MDF2178628.1 threonine/serine exporter family protein [Aliiglaciecola sp. CAU 1673]